MPSQEQTNFARYLPAIVFILLLVISFFIIKPFLNTLILAAVLSYIFFPLYSAVRKKIKNSTVSSILVCIFIAAAVFFAGFYLTKLFISQTRNVFFDIKLGTLGVTEFQNILSSVYVKPLAEKATGWLIERGTDFLVSLPLFLINIVILFFALFYAFKNSNAGKKALELIPIKTKYKEALYTETRKISTMLLYGVVLVGIIQGLIGGLGLWIFGIPNPLFWTLIMIVLAILPVGPWLVWLPAALFKLLSADYFSGIGLLLYGFFIISLTDNYARSVIIGKKTGIHPLLILIGSLGAIPVFGIIGIIIGPLILAFTLSFLKIYKEETVS